MAPAAITATRPGPSLAGSGPGTVQWTTTVARHVFPEFR